jgi:hypothetical protein
MQLRTCATAAPLGPDGRDYIRRRPHPLADRTIGAIFDAAAVDHVATIRVGNCRF